MKRFGEALLISRCNRLALFDNLTPAQNFFAGREIAGPHWLPRGLRFLKKRQMDAAARTLLDELKASLPGPDAMVAMMSRGSGRPSPWRVQRCSRARW